MNKEEIKNLLLFKNTHNLFGWLASLLTWMYIVLMPLLFVLIVGVELGWWSI